MIIIIIKIMIIIISMIIIIIIKIIRIIIKINKNINNNIEIKIINQSFEKENEFFSESNNKFLKLKNI